MEKSTLFIASSVEGLPIADAINVNLDHDVHCTIWRNGTFKLGSDGLGDLIKKSSAVDFAVFVFTPDDITTMRNKEVIVARDNVVFELGLFIGALGKDRCYVVKPRGIEMHLPSDVAGVTTADYVADRPDGDIASALNPACAQIKARIKELGSLSRLASAAGLGGVQHIPNPPEYKLSSVDLEFLAQCVRSHVAFPNGLSFHWISSQIHSEDYRISLAAVKLTRLGYIEKSVEMDETHDHFFAYRATEDGLDVFLKHEDRYSELSEEEAEARRLQVRHSSRGTRGASKGFDDMDDDIKF